VLAAGAGAGTEVRSVLLAVPPILVVVALLVAPWLAIDLNANLPAKTMALPEVATARAMDSSISMPIFN